MARHMPGVNESGHEYFPMSILSSTMANIICQVLHGGNGGMAGSIHLKL